MAQVLHGLTAVHIAFIFPKSCLGCRVLCHSSTAIIPPPWYLLCFSPFQLHYKFFLILIKLSCLCTIIFLWLKQLFLPPGISYERLMMPGDLWRWRTHGERKQEMLMMRRREESRYGAGIRQSSCTVALKFIAARPCFTLFKQPQGIFFLRLDLWG